MSSVLRKLGRPFFALLIMVEYIWKNVCISAQLRRNFVAGIRRSVFHF